MLKNTGERTFSKKQMLCTVMAVAYRREQTGATYRHTLISAANWMHLNRQRKFCEILSTKVRCAAHLRRVMLRRLRAPLAVATSDGSLTGVLVPMLPPAAGGGWTELVSKYVWTRALLFWTAFWCHGPPMSKPKPSTAVGGAAPVVPLIGLWVCVTPGGEFKNSF